MPLQLDLSTTKLTYPFADIVLRVLTIEAVTISLHQTKMLPTDLDVCEIYSVEMISVIGEGVKEFKKIKQNL